VAAYCLLRIREDGAKLVEVQALARSQGQGVGRAVIWAAAASARREKINPIFVECEASTWAQTVYRRLGFDEAGVVHRFVRPW
jgi:GNAT superfamily N-acetyltransferase